jgi:hypothetical protein
MADRTVLDLFEAVRQMTAAFYPGIVPETVEISLSNGQKLSLFVPPAAIQANRQDRPATRHSVDFRSVHWHGVDYQFTATQASIVRLLWEAWEAGTPDVGQETLLEGAGSDGNRLRDLFHRGAEIHPAWGTMIVSFARGTYRLAEPG